MRAQNDILTKQAVEKRMMALRYSVIISRVIAIAAKGHNRVNVPWRSRLKYIVANNFDHQGSFNMPDIVQCTSLQLSASNEI